VEHEGLLLSSPTDHRGGSFVAVAGHVETVTRKNVAGIEVVPLLGLAFCALNSASSSACSSPLRPSAAAASNAFIVGP
jgi:hypothetical protein